jgi:antitoxin component YwqK of YwqJK toxin-antitoxin module
MTVLKLIISFCLLLTSFILGKFDVVNRMKFFKNDLRHGYWERYHPNGNLWWKGNYINGEPDGYWEWYDPNSNIIEKQFFL